MQLGRNVIFPIKSLDGFVVEEAAITAGGILENDRIYAMHDAEGNYVNGKRNADVHLLRCSFDEKIREVRLWRTGEFTPSQFPLDALESISSWLSGFFGFAVTLRHDAEKGFPDDREAYGPTIVSEASLRAIQEWFPEAELASVRRRFRANLELTGTEPFGEDRLFGAPGERKPFQIGAVQFLGHNPCQRCVVPTRDPDTADAIPLFQKKFAQLRQEHLPEWSNRERFNHFYRFAINTSIPSSEAGKRLRAGDSVTL